MLFEKRDGVARITLNRPDEANAIDVPMLKTLFEIAIECDEDPSVRAILLTGKGDFFCSGGDLKFFQKNSDRVAHLLKEGTSYLHTAQAIFARMDAPMVVAVNGIAAGGGASLAFSGDIVLAAQSASFTMAYTAAGLSPDGGSTYYLPRLIGLRRAQELFLTNRRFSAEEACDWGLVTRVLPDDKLMAEAEAMVERFASGPSQAYGAVKRLLASTFETPMEAQLARETRDVAGTMSSHDGREGIAAFIGKRSPKFTGNR
ncbi:MAG: enoyl-CoA hydratase/isomerase family protein [Alphaproteobacteria bacterium]